MDYYVFSMATSNLSSQGLLPHRTWKSSGLIPALLVSFCFLLGVPGNIAVILLKPNWRNMSHLSRSLMLNLAISDLLSLLTLPLWIYALLKTWTFGVLTCKLLGFLVYCSLYGSLLTVTVLSVQRYNVVVHQRRYNKVQKRLMLVLLWVFAMILSIPTLVVEQLQTNKQWTYCYPQFSSKAQGVAVLLSETTCGFVSLSVVAYSYIRLRRKVDQATFFNNRQTTRLMTSIIVNHFLLWSPLHTINMLALGAISVNNKGLLKFCVDIWDIVKGIAFLNNCLNPVLYAFTSHRICISKKQEELQQVRPSQTQDVSIVAEATIIN